MLKAACNSIFLFFLALTPHRGFGAEFSHTPYSKAQLGYLIHTSSVGITRAGGSTIILDAGISLLDTLQIGLKSIATGADTGTQDVSFYRLATGPHLLYKPFTGWAVHFSPAFFTETAYFIHHRDQNDRPSTSRYSGTQLLAGWEKILYEGDSIQIAWGGMWLFHNGTSSGSNSLQDRNPTAPQASKGRAQGLSISAEFIL